MTVILVLVTFLAFILIDALLNWRRGTVPKAAMIEVPPEPEARVISGFEAPEDLRYHPGHTWLKRERKNVNRVGADQFAAAILGTIEKIELPKPGHWIRQGQKVFAMTKNGEKVDMVSPVEGEVVEVNQELAANPALLATDPYGKGWLVSVFSPDEEGPARNLLPRNMVSAWLRDAADRLYALQPALAGATSADGGVPVQDASAALPTVSLARLGREFFLS